MKVKPKTNFVRMKERQLYVLGINVLKALIDNPDFPDPYPPLSVLETDLEAFNAALAESDFGGRLSTELKRQKREKLEDTMRLLALYVQRVAKGDLAIVLGSGFEYNKPKGQTEPCPKPPWIRIEHGPVGSGWLILRTKSYRKARNYRFEYRLKGTETWTEVLTSKSHIQLNTLEKFQVYEFRVTYLGTHPRITYSDIIEGYAV